MPVNECLIIYTFIITTFTRIRCIETLIKYFHHKVVIIVKIRVIFANCYIDVVFAKELIIYSFIKATFTRIRCIETLINNFPQKVVIIVKIRVIFANY